MADDRTALAAELDVDRLAGDDVDGNRRGQIQLAASGTGSFAPDEGFAGHHVFDRETPSIVRDRRIREELKVMVACVPPAIKLNLVSAGERLALRRFARCLQFCRTARA